ncbi:MAG: ABC transporter permease [Acidobacteriota bacterium]
MVGLIRRLAVAGLTVVLASLALYGAFATMPGDPLAPFVRAEELTRITPEQRAALASRHGLDRPVVVRWASWLARSARGDLGRSLRSGRPVGREIAERVGATVELNLVATLLALAVGLPLGWGSALRPGSRADRWGAAVTLALYALPYFWLALILQHVFAVRLGWLPLYGRTGTGDAGLAAHLRHLVLPAGSLALHMVAFYARFARGATIDGLRALSARVARCLGLPERTILMREGIRPSLVPLATLAGLLLPAMASGSILVETIFSWPGLGSLFVTALGTRDLPVVLALTSLTVVLTVAGSLLADALTWAADPRRRAGRLGAPAR